MGLRSIEVLANVAASLGMIALCFGARGEVSLYDGKEDGWAEIHQAIVYHYWAARCRVLSFEGYSRAPRLTTYIPRIANLICAGLACGKGEWAAWAYGILQVMGGRPDYANPQAWEESLSREIATRLYCAATCQPVQARCSQPVYAQLFLDGAVAPFSPDAVAGALDLHYHNMGEDDVDYTLAPFDLMPWEILSLCRLLGEEAYASFRQHFSSLSNFAYPDRILMTDVRDPVIEEVEAVLVTLSR
jgi:hypothetical protein